MAISSKQKQILAFPFTGYDALICDGSIRSGKTMMMIVAFVDWAMRSFDRQRFAICGKTVDSTVKNIIKPYLALTYWRNKYKITWHKSDKTMVVRYGNRENVFEVFGGRDESSYALIQGRTLAGVLLDEVALMPRSFVEQACARCSVADSKMWFNCNPGSPQHWFYTDWICAPEKHNALHLHFSLEDNPSLSQRIIDRYKSMYTGVFYKRYVRGEWCVAEGLVYDFGEDNIVDEIPSNGEYYISIDYGTMNPFSAGSWCVVGGNAVRIKEFYYNGRKSGVQRTDEQYCDDIEALAKGYDIKRVIVDPSAASFITALRNRKFSVIKANNDVFDGIRRTAEFLREGKIKIHRSCTDCRAEFGLYRWDEKATQDTVIKENDHCLTGDTIVNTVFGGRKIKDLVGKFGFVWSYDEKRKKKCIRPFFGVKKTRENQPILKITLENGKVVRCTPDHRILTDNGWIEAKYLTQSSKVIDIMD